MPLRTEPLPSPRWYPQTLSQTFADLSAGAPASSLSRNERLWLRADFVPEEALTRAQLVGEKAALAIRIGVHPYHWLMLLLTSVVEQPNTRNSAKLEKDFHSQQPQGEMATACLGSSPAVLCFSVTQRLIDRLE